MTNPNPITPPPELVQEWLKTHYSDLPGQIAEPSDSALHIAAQAARWGADQELSEACRYLARYIEDGRDIDEMVQRLRAARRPKQPSLKELALAKLEAMERLWEASGKEPSDTIRRALEQLPEGPDVTHSIGCEHMGGPIHAGTVTTHVVPKPPEPAAAPDRPEAGE